MDGPKININNLTDHDLYINHIQVEKQTPELLNLSWYDMVEEELRDSLEDKILTGSIVSDRTDTSDDSDKKISAEEIDSIVRKNCNKLTDVCILEYQLHISNFIRELLKSYNDDNKCFSLDNILGKLKWLVTASKYLSNKLGLSIYSHKQIHKNDKHIPRSSYKFCDYNYECEFNYNTKKYEGCFAQHFVHNLVLADLEALINYINTHNNLGDRNIREEIKKSINTISFVINHMYEELKNVNMYIQNDTVHMERTPNKKSRRPKKRRKNVFA